jgi:mycoredoxin
MQKIIFYGHAFCPQVYTVRRELDRNAIDYEYIDIRKDPDAAVKVREINKGYESVPTLVFPDGSKLTEPSTIELLNKLRDGGKEVKPAPSAGWIALLLEGPGLRLVAALFVLAGIFTDLQVLTWVGLGMLAVSFLQFFIHKRT